MDKKFLITEIIKELEAQKMQNEISLKATLQAAIEAPGAMESHSDTTKAQMHTLADNLRNSLTEKERAISVLRNLPEDQLQQSEVVQIGSVVEIQESGDKRNSYFVLPEGGGIEVKDEKRCVFVIASRAPLAKVLIGKKKGDSTKLQIPSSSGKDREMTILNVW
mgnify:CR=1 FL=1